MRIVKLFPIYNYTILTLIIFSVICLTSCKPKDDKLLPGYIEGKYTYISASYSGILKSLYVKKGKEIKVDQQLFSLELRPELDELLIAQAQVNQALNNTEALKIDCDLKNTLLDHKTRLYQKKAITKEEVDSSAASYQSAYANLKSAEDNIRSLQANVQKLEWIIKQKTVNSPISGVTFDIYYNIGEFVTSGSPVVSLLDASQVKIIFYIPEILLSKLKLDQLIQVACDNCNKPIKGKIVYISNAAEYTPPVIYSDTIREKLVYRIEAEPLSPAFPLEVYPGQPITVKID